MTSLMRYLIEFVVSLNMYWIVPNNNFIAFLIIKLNIKMLIAGGDHGQNSFAYRGALVWKSLPNKLQIS